jgi:hypothetical protein
MPWNMEKRRYKRINYKLNADVICDTENYKGIIENLSASGIFKIVISDKSVIAFVPGGSLRVRFESPSGQHFDLDCEIRWSRINTRSPFVLKYNLGVQIIEPPQDYADFLKSLL